MGNPMNAPFDFARHVVFDKILGGDSGGDKKANMKPTNRRLDRLIAGQGLKPVGKTARRSQGKFLTYGGG